MTFSRIALAAVILTVVGAAAPVASASNQYPPGWNKAQTPPPAAVQFTPGSNHMHFVPGVATTAGQAPNVTHRIIYQFVPGGSKYHAISQ